MARELIMVTCTRKLQWCMGHRVMGHENKCAHLHGHNYEAHVVCKADALDSVGRVVDFSVIKQELGQWIDQYWDHGFVLYFGDNNAIKAVEGFLVREEHRQKLYLMDDNPTAENLALLLLLKGNELLKQWGVSVVEVTVHETPNCYATAKAAV